MCLAGNWGITLFHVFELFALSNDFIMSGGEFPFCSNFVGQKGLKDRMQFIGNNFLSRKKRMNDVLVERLGGSVESFDASMKLNQDENLA